MKLQRVAVNLIGCNGHIDVDEALQECLNSAIVSSGYTVIEKYNVAFQPHGTTIVFVLAESHAVLSTWPELKFASLDLGLCGNVEAWRAIVSALENILQPVRVETDFSTTYVPDSSTS